MRRNVVIAVAVVAVVVGAIVFLPSRSSTGPQPIAYGRDTCARCRMIVAQPGFGGELRDAQGKLSTFDDVGCLVQAIQRSHAALPGAWVEDHAGKGFVPLLRATFVKGVETPMNHGIVAFADPNAAAAFAKEKGAQVVTLESLLRDPALGASQTVASAVAADAPFTEGEASLGRAIYTRECSACHGDRGDAKTVAAALLDPKPRDFTKRTFRFRSTESGQPSRAADVVKTIERGISGSAMPSFAFLTPDERRQAGAYVFKLAGLLGRPEPKAVALGDAPPVSAASIAHGREVFQKNGCFQCHGAEGRGDGPQSATLKNAEGFPIRPRDFTAGVYKGGGDRADIVMRLSTGLDGTPMPSWADGVPLDDRWALADFVMSLKKPAAPAPFPADAIAAGRMLVERRHCNACHVVDDGKGGVAGPDLRVSGQKLDPAFVKRFLSDPRSYGKVYPWRVSRMPDLQLTPEEVEVASRYLAAMGGRSLESPALPDPAEFTTARLTEGVNVFTIRCAQCHALGEIVKTPEASQQGPNLIRVAHRIDYRWMKKWVTDPKKVDPNTKMAVPGITPDEVDAVRAFVFKSSMEAQGIRTTRAGERAEAP